MKTRTINGILFVFFFAGKVFAASPVATQLYGINEVQFWIHLSPATYTDFKVFGELEQRLRQRIESQLRAADLQVTEAASVDLNLGVEFVSLQEGATAMAFFLEVCDEATLDRDPEKRLLKGCAVTWSMAQLVVVNETNFGADLEETAVGLISSFVGALQGARAWGAREFDLKPDGRNR